MCQSDPALEKYSLKHSDHFRLVTTAALGIWVITGGEAPYSFVEFQIKSKYKIFLIL